MTEEVDLFAQIAAASMAGPEGSASVATALANLKDLNEVRMGDVRISAAKRAVRAMSPELLAEAMRRSGADWYAAGLEQQAAQQRAAAAEQGEEASHAPQIAQEAAAWPLQLGQEAASEAAAAQAESAGNEPAEEAEEPEPVASAGKGPLAAEVEADLAVRRGMGSTLQPDGDAPPAEADEGAEKPPMLPSFLRRHGQTMDDPKPKFGLNSFKEEAAKKAAAAEGQVAIDPDPKKNRGLGFGLKELARQAAQGGQGSSAVQKLAGK